MGKATSGASGEDMSKPYKILRDKLTPTNREIYDRVIVDERLGALKEVIKFNSQSIPEKFHYAFFSQLSTWAAGMAAPEYLEKNERTKAIRAFFRGMKRKK